MKWDDLSPADTLAAEANVAAKRSDLGGAVDRKKKIEKTAFKAGYAVEMNWGDLTPDKPSAPPTAKVKPANDPNWRVVEEGTRMTPEQIKQAREWKTSLLPGEGIKDPTALDARLTQMAEQRKRLVAAGYPTDTLDARIREFSQVKNDIERLRKGGKVSPHAPSVGGRPPDRPEDLAWNQKGFAADIGAGIQSGVVGLGKVVRGTEKMLGVTPSEGFDPALAAGEEYAGYSEQRGGEGISHEVVRGLASMGVQLPVLMAGGTFGMGVIGAGEAAAQPDASPTDVALSAATMATMGKVLHESGGLSISKRVLLGAGVGAGVTAAQGGNRQQIIAQGILFGGTGAAGGKAPKVGERITARDGKTYEVAKDTGEHVELRPIDQEPPTRAGSTATGDKVKPLTAPEGAHPAVAESRYAYRSRDAGEQGVPSQSHSQATLSQHQAESYVESRGSLSGKPQEIVRVDMWQLDPAKYDVREAPGDTHWVKFKEDLPESAVEPVGNKAADRRQAENGPPVASFTTAKGSTYKVNADGTTTRDKSYHPEHGTTDQGPQPPSAKTYYVSSDDALKLAEIQTEGPKRVIGEAKDGRIGVRYEEGKDAGKIEYRTLVAPKDRPAVGLTPVEVWANGRVHFGNEITEVRNAERRGFEMQPQEREQVGQAAEKFTAPETAKGAGAAPVGYKQPESEIVQLGEAARGATEAAKTAGEQASELTRLPRESGRFGPALSLASQKVRQTVGRLWQSYKAGPAQPISSVESASMELFKEHSRVQLDAREFSKQVKGAIPDTARRDAIFRYAAAGGDRATLQGWAATSKNPRAKVGYENALKLTDAERAVADNFVGFFRPMLEQGMDAGVIQSAVDDYVTQIVKRGPKGSKLEAMRGQMQADAQASLLNPNFKHARQRVFPNIFEGEQAGYTYDTDFASAASQYYTSMGRAIASRNYLKSLQKLTASDGRPAASVSGYGVPLDNATLVKPDAKVARGANVSDYKPVDHWAFKGWKWIDNIQGRDLMLQGDLLVHPEFATKTKARFEPSAIRKSAIGRGALKAQAVVKGTMFSLSPFHLVTEVVHAAGHTVNPLWNLPELKTAGGRHSAELMEALKGGLQVAGGSGHELFAEGLSGQGGLVGKLPGIGKLNAQWSDWLFHDYIPRLKFKTYQHILERNLKRYSGELAREQVVSLSADQANAAYGELNYFKLGRSKTMQDLSRLLLLAPDFLEARGRFVGQAAKGYGREQLRALLLLGMTQYVSARIANQLGHGDAEWDVKHAFQIKVGESFYGLRSVPADILHAASDPRGFALWRANPLLVVTPMELATGTELRSGGKDIGNGWTVRRGLTTSQVGLRAAERALPLPVQGLTKEDTDLLESLLGAVGVVEHRQRQAKGSGRSSSGLGRIR